MADDQKGSDFKSNDGNWVSKKHTQDSTGKYQGSQAFKDLKHKKSAFLGEKKILRLLSQDGAIGIRTYLGIDTQGNPQLFMVALDAEGNEILRAENPTPEQKDGLILDDNRWCPPLCDPPGVLG